MNESLNLQDTIENFCTSFEDNQLINIVPFGNGHINDTYLLTENDKDKTAYLLQRINDHVFKNVDGLSHNIELVTAHLRDKVKASGGNPGKEVLQMVAAKDGSFFQQDQLGQYWRMYVFLPNTKSYDVVATEEQAYQGGKAFGRFQAMLTDLPAAHLVATIPDFLNMEKRMEAFNKAVSANKAGSAALVQEQISHIRRNAKKMCFFQQANNGKKLPLRVVHNDTKFNNVLLDEADLAQCVIDLDTVMPGYVAYDFGDAVRTMISTSAEDEADLNRIQLNMPFFKAFTRGYLEEASWFLTAGELQSLVIGALLLPFMQGVRFLTDHLDGDLYYKIKFEGHNLQRAKAQLELFRKLEEKSGELAAIIMDIHNEVTSSSNK